MLTQNLAKEWAPQIRVNSISPGPVLLPETYTPEQRERARERTLLKRLGSPEDIAQAALFLIGNDYMTGCDLAVDGGRSLV
jgi:NAD(P)-dependent dehydrogenase (short-subunit alcohol dehydrogenase family)